MSDAFRESNTNTYRNIVTFQSGFGVIADEPFTVGSPTTTQSLLVAYNPIKPLGGISGYAPLTGQSGLEYIRTPFGFSGQGWFLDLRNGKLISNGVAIVDAGGTSLSTAGGAESMDWSQMQLMVDSNGTLDWGAQIAYDGNSFSSSLDWTKRFLYDSGTQPSMNWARRQLLGTGVIGRYPSGVKLDWSGTTVRVPISPQVPNGLMWAYEDPTNSGNNFYVTSTALHPDTTRWGFAPCDSKGVTDFSWGFEFTSNHYTILQGYQNGGSFSVDPVGNTDIYGNNAITLHNNISVEGYVQASSLFDNDYSVTAVTFTTNHFLHDLNGNTSCDFGGYQLVNGNGANVCFDWGSQHLIGNWTIDSITTSGVAVTTGGPYYPLKSNPSGYITNSQTGQFYTNSNPSGYITGVISPSTSVSTVINWASGNTFYATLTGNTTFTFTGQKDGQTIVLSVRNTGTNNFTGAWPLGTRWPFQTAPTQTSGSFTDIYTFVNITGTIYGNSVQGY